LSSASTWEIKIKSSIGKITLPEQADIFIQKQLDLNRLNLLDIKIDHTFEILKLPLIH
jgi:PIN domain nuclease of toxin-antitoxin system